MGVGGIPTDLSTILRTFRDKLIDDGVFTDSTCWLSATPDVLKYPPSDRFIVVSPGDQNFEQPIIAGTGNRALAVDGTVNLTFRSRLNLDELPRSDVYLTDDSLGLLPGINCIIASLSMYMPKDSEGNSIFSEPARPVRIYPPELERGNEQGWGKVQLSWEVRWNQQVTCP